MEAGLTGDVNFDTGLLAAMTARRKLDLTEERDPFLERVRFNVNVDTATPILVDNNLARAEVRARLRVVGTPYEPGLSGQADPARGRRDHAERTALRGRARRHHVRRRAAHLPVVRPAAQHVGGQLRHHHRGHRHARRYRDHADVGADAARARHHGDAGDRPHPRRDARRGVRGRPGTGAVVSGRTGRDHARPRPARRPPVSARSASSRR